MMIPNRSGEVTLASGNVFSWWSKNEIGRGACGGSFREPPSAADVTEARAFIERLVPERSLVVLDKIGDAAEIGGALASHFAEGMSRN
jgi:hypothetical protein